MDIELKDFETAQERLRPILHHTELDLSSTFSAMTGGKIYLKCENRQKTGSFKIRGASNKIAAMIERGERCPVVASSAGNHAQGVACAAKKFGIPATIVMPKTAPIAKAQATEGYGAKVVLAGDCYDDAYARACEICREEGAAFLHPYNDLEVIAGQGTLGLEVLGDLPSVDIVIVPAGGGGLLAGVAAAIKQVNPRVKVYGVQAEGADAIARSFREGKLVTTDTASTIADGIAVKAPGDISVELIRRYADGVLTVSDTAIADAILLLLERCKQVVEPAGATPLAAVLSGALDVKGKRVVCVLSGGNIEHHRARPRRPTPPHQVFRHAARQAGQPHAAAGRHLHDRRQHPADPARQDQRGPQSQRDRGARLPRGRRRGARQVRDCRAQGKRLSRGI